MPLTQQDSQFDLKQNAHHSANIFLFLVSSSHIFPNFFLQYTHRLECFSQSDWIKKLALDLLPIEWMPIQKSQLNLYQSMQSNDIAFQKLKDTCSGIFSDKVETKAKGLSSGVFSFFCSFHNTTPSRRITIIISRKVYDNYSYSVMPTHHCNESRAIASTLPQI